MHTIYMIPDHPFVQLAMHNKVFPTQTRRHRTTIICAAVRPHQTLRMVRWLRQGLKSLLLACFLLIIPVKRVQSVSFQPGANLIANLFPRLHALSRSRPLTTATKAPDDTITEAIGYLQAIFIDRHKFSKNQWKDLVEELRVLSNSTVLVSHRVSYPWNHT